MVWECVVAQTQKNYLSLERKRPWPHSLGQLWRDIPLACCRAFYYLNSNIYLLLWLCLHESICYDCHKQKSPKDHKLASGFNNQKQKNKKKRRSDITSVSESQQPKTATLRENTDAPSIFFVKLLSKGTSTDKIICAYGSSINAAPKAQNVCVRERAFCFLKHLVHPLFFPYLALQMLIVVCR